MFTKREVLFLTTLSVMVVIAFFTLFAVMGRDAPQKIGTLPTLAASVNHPQELQLTFNPDVVQQESAALPVVASLSENPIPNRAILQLAPDSTNAEIEAFLDSLGASIVGQIDVLNMIVIDLPVGSKITLDDNAPILAIENDYYVQALQATPPDDPLYGQQWGLDAIGAPSAWEAYAATAAPVTVAVLDSGICAEHPELAGRLVEGYDYVENDSTPQDEFGHGCAIAGIIAANSNNGIGIAGLAANASIMPLRILDAAGVGTYSRLAAAIVDASDNGADIINISVGGVSTSPVLAAAVDYASAQGVTLVAAAGNDAADFVRYPAAYDSVIAVGAIDNDGSVSSFSNVGAGIDVYAPGNDIVSLALNGANSYSGTSFSAAFASGAIALVGDITLDGSILNIAPGIIVQPPLSTDVSGQALPPGRILIEGDMLVPENYHELVAQGTYVPDFWTNGTIPYQFANSVSNQVMNNTLAAMDLWDGTTIAGGDPVLDYLGRPINIRFVPRNGQSNYVTIRQDDDLDGSQGYSDVGMNGGQQYVTLSPGASTGLIAHELGHTIGLKHEQTHPNRDQFVQINLANAQDDKVGNFNIDDRSRGHAGVPYDFDSTMHYGPHTFAKCTLDDTPDCTNGTEDDTILIRPEWAFMATNGIGIRAQPSQGDLDTVTFMYNFCRSDGSLIIFDDSIELPPGHDSGTVWLNGWYTSYSTDTDHHSQRIEAEIDNVHVTGNTLRWTVTGHFRDDNADDNSCFYYIPQIYTWDSSKVYLNRSPEYAASAAGKGVLPLDSLQDVGASEDTAPLPLGFELSYDDDDHHVLRMGYQLDYTGATAYIKDNNSDDDTTVSHRFTGLEGISLVYIDNPDVTLMAEDECGGCSSTWATVHTDYVTMIVPNVDDAIPVLSGWELYRNEDRHVLEAGFWIWNPQYDPTTDELTFFVNYVLTDDEGNRFDRNYDIDVIGILDDSDGDGIPSQIEDDAPNNGDGNADGIPDSLQSDVASFPNKDDGLYVTIETSAGYFDNVEPMEGESEIDYLETVMGLVSFDVAGLAPGQSVEVTLIDHGNHTTDIYYKAADVPGSATPFRYDFASNTGAVRSANIWTLYLIDGQRGDFDLSADGVIRDPGMPVLALDVTPPISNPPALSGTMGNNGWYTSYVDVEFSATDDWSGVYQIEYRIDGGTIQRFDPVAGLLFNLEGVHTIEYRAEDIAANVEGWNSMIIKVDTRPPTIDITSDKDVYTRIEPVIFDVVVADPVPGSGIFYWEAQFAGTPVVDGSVFDIFWWDLGTYPYDGYVEDYAGLSDTDAGQIELIATLESLEPTVDRLCDEGHISSQNGKGNCNAFAAKIRAANRSNARGNPNAAINQLNALIHQANALCGKRLTKQAYHILYQDLAYVINTLGGTPVASNPQCVNDAEIELALGQLSVEPLMNPEIQVQETVEVIEPSVSPEVPALETVEVIEPSVSPEAPAVLVTPEATEPSVNPEAPVQETPEATEPSVNPEVPVQETSEVIEPSASPEVPAVLVTPEVFAPEPTPTIDDLLTRLDECLLSKRVNFYEYVKHGQWDVFRDNVEQLGNLNQMSSDCVADLTEMAAYFAASG